VLESTVPLGLCSGGFSSTAGYVPGNEALVPKDSSDIAPVWLIISKGRCPFLSEQLRPALRLTLASLSASASDVPDSGFPLLLSANGVSPPPFHLPMPVKMPVSNLDCEAILHPLFSMSSRKYINYCPYFTGLLWIFCGKPCGKNVDENVENLASHLVLQVKEFGTFWL